MSDTTVLLFPDVKEAPEVEEIRNTLAFHEFVRSGKTLRFAFFTVNGNATRMEWEKLVDFATSLEDAHRNIMNGGPVHTKHVPNPVNATYFDWFMATKHVRHNITSSVPHFFWQGASSSRDEQFRSFPFCCLPDVAKLMREAYKRGNALRQNHA